MLKIIFLLLYICLLSSVQAKHYNQPQECTLVAGKIIQNPSEPIFKFVKSHKYSTDRYVISHTKFFIHGIDDHNYEIIMNNLFYTWTTASQAITNKDIGITENMRHNYPIGSDIVACGKPFNSDGQRGVHFVHSSGCDKTQFNGYLKINGSYVTDNNSFCNACNCKL